MNANQIVTDYLNKAGLSVENSEALNRCIEEQTLIMPLPPLPSTDFTLIRVTQPSSTSRSSGRTVKVANIFFSLKTFASVVLDTTAGILSIVSSPQLFWLHGLRLIATLKKDATLDLSEGEALIVLVLFSNHGFDRFVAEDSLFLDIKEFLESRSLPLIKEPDFIRANTHLQALRVIEIDAGNIKLVERVEVA
jgi:hypothetical protein